MSELSRIPPAVILAAGRGNRLLPLTQDRPKCMLEVGGRSILEHQLQALRLAGVPALQIVTGHGADVVHAACDGWADYAHNERYDQTNSFDSLGFCTLDVAEAGLLVLNSDVLFHPQLLTRLIDDPRPNVLLTDFKSNLGEEEMKIVVDEENRIVHISKTVDPRKAHGENLGVLKLSPEAARRMLDLGASRDRKLKLSWVPDGIHFLREQFPFYALNIEGLPWTEIDYPHDLEKANREVYPLLHNALWKSGAGAPVLK